MSGEIGERAVGELLRKVASLEGRVRYLEALDGGAVSTTWTPVIAQNGMQPLNTVNSALYQRRGGLVWACLKATFTGDSSGTGQITVTGLPTAEIGGLANGTFRHYDGTTNHIGNVEFDYTDPTRVSFVTAESGINYHAVQIETGDTLSFTIEYEPS